MLNPNGNCLGVALCHCWRMANFEVPDVDLERASTVADAIASLSLLREPQLVVRRGAGIFERWTMTMNAKRFQIRCVEADSLSNAICLSLRSMRQLYGIPRLDGHWIASRMRAGTVETFDDLWATVLQEYPNAQPLRPDQILKQAGPTLLVVSR